MQITIEKKDIDCIARLAVEQQVRVMDLMKDSLSRMDVDELSELMEELKALRGIQNLMKCSVTDEIDKADVSPKKVQNRSVEKKDGVFYQDKTEAMDGTPYLAYSGKGRKPLKRCGICLLFKDGKCINGDKVTENHVCAMFEKDTKESGFVRKDG